VQVEAGDRRWLKHLCLGCRDQKVDARGETDGTKAFVAGRTNGPVFLAGAVRISMRHAQRRLGQWFAKGKIAGRSAHSLRHTFAGTLLARTGDLRLVQAAMNHASIVSTTIYTTVAREKLRAAVGS